MVSADRKNTQNKTIFNLFTHNIGGFIFNVKKTKKQDAKKDTKLKE